MRRESPMDSQQWTFNGHLLIVWETQTQHCSRSAWVYPWNGSWPPCYPSIAHYRIHISRPIVSMSALLVRVRKTRYCRGSQDMCIAVILATSCFMSCHGITCWIASKLEKKVDCLFGRVIARHFISSDLCSRFVGIVQWKLRTRMEHVRDHCLSPSSGPLLKGWPSTCEKKRPMQTQNNTMGIKWVIGKAHVATC